MVPLWQSVVLAGRGGHEEVVSYSRNSAAVVSESNFPYGCAFILSFVLEVLFVHLGPNRLSRSLSASAQRVPTQVK